MAINLRLPDKLHAEITAAAAADGLSINAFIIKAMRAQLRRRGGFDDYRPPFDQAALNRDLIRSARNIVKAAEAAKIGDHFF